VLGAVVALLLIGGVSYELMGEQLDARRYPRQGRLVALGPQFPGVSLNIDCTGPATAPGPTIILESGLGIAGYDWKLVQEPVAQFARVCSYDRAGYGWSSAGPLPRTSLEIAKELHALLGAAGEKGPFVLVGHSFGGFNIRVYTGLYPRDVVGMVLVDASNEDMVARFPPAVRSALQKPVNYTFIRIILKTMLHLGVMRAVGFDASTGDDSVTISRDVLALAREVWALTLSAKFLDANISEGQWFDRSGAQARSAGDLGDRPLIVLTAGRFDALDGLPPGIAQKDKDEAFRIWSKELQVNEMHLSTRGKQIIVAGSGHSMMVERHGAITAAIREVWQAARQRSAQ